MYRNLLLATDGERGATTATEHAVALAAAVDAVLHAVHVIDTDLYAAYGGDEYVAEAEGLDHALEERGRAALADVRDRAEAAGVAVETDLRRGNPAESVVAAAAETDADLVVVGTARRSDEYRSLLGSVAERVTRLADRPTLVVKTDATD